MSAEVIKILLVEDNPGDARLLRETLVAVADAPFEVTHVERLGEALQRLEAARFDVVLLDLSLPDSQGFETLVRLREHAPGAPIIVLTGTDDEALAVKAVQMGAQDYLVKGQVNRSLLVRAVRYAIERQRAEETLRQQRAWLDATLSSIGDAVIATDLSGIITFMNPIAARLTGWSAEVARGHHIDEVFGVINEHTRQAVASPVAHVLHEGTVVGLANHTALLARDGSAVPIADSAAPIRDSSGRLYGVVLVFRDISERKRLEEQLQQAHKMEAMGTLAGGIAHDFNNILAAILGFTELAVSDIPSSSTAYSALQRVLTAGQRARDLVQQILAFSRQTPTMHEPVQLQGLIREVLTLLRASLPSTIAIQQHLTTEVGTVLADRIQIHQILMNLCANAEYAMRETGGVLEVRLEAIAVDAARAAACPGLRPGPYVRLLVRDTGPGIAPDVLARIFEPFFTTKGPGKGTGMGLAMVHGIVASHGGALTVSSIPGQGAAFEIYLPRSEEAAADDTHAEEPLPRGQGCLLLVDDEAAVARMGQTVLERLGYEVVVCLSSFEALEVFRAAPQRFDLVVTDQTMPGMTGEALVHALRGMRPDLPIVLCTGFSYSMDAQQAEAAGIDAFLNKPWATHDFAHTISRVLEQRRGRQA